jgi:tight adherence protein B
MAVAASLKAGHSFKQGIQTLVEEAQDPAKKEFQRVLAEASLGRPIDDALGDMAERLGSKNFAFIVTAVAIQNQVGGSLATLFDMVADTVRQRQQFARKVRALTSMGRASAYVLIALPIFLALLMTAVNHKYMSPLFFTSTGHVLIIVGLIGMTIGSLILKKIVGFKG